MGRKPRPRSGLAGGPDASASEEPAVSDRCRAMPTGSPSPSFSFGGGRGDAETASARRIRLGVNLWEVLCVELSQPLRL